MQNYNKTKKMIFRKEEVEFLGHHIKFNQESKKKTKLKLLYRLRFLRIFIYFTKFIKNYLLKQKPLD